MQVALLVEDRENGYVFLDTQNAPEDAVPHELSLDPGVVLEEAMDEMETVWLMNDRASTLRVVKRESYDYDDLPADPVEYPIPTPTLCLTKADFETLIA